MSEVKWWASQPWVAAALCLPVYGIAAEAVPVGESELAEVKVSAEAILKQAPGVSIIDKADIEKVGVTNDLSEVIRKMPGVNLTGNSASGTRGNNRQIDLRGMGPENTLILIDGMPVMSRTAVKYNRTGERDTRGDSNWVPAEMVDSIEVIRGPAAARYGSGASGGVVNIITKGTTSKTQGSVTVYADEPQHSDYGSTRRVNGSLSGPITETLSYRAYANYNKTDMDDPAINVANTATGVSTAAGREGVKNKDFSGLLRWKPLIGHVVDFDYAFSRQGNIYAGDTQTGASATSSATATGTNPASFLGQETNAMTRRNYAVSHKGNWSFGSTSSFIQYEKTNNERYNEGSVGSTDGNINSSAKSTGTLDSHTLHTELTRQVTLGLPQMLTMGLEWNNQLLDDPGTILNGTTISGVAGVADSAAARATATSARMGSVFVEDRIDIGGLSIVPALRLDRHSRFGNNWSPALNLSQDLGDGFMLKGGIARAFKAPNLYQTNSQYLNFSSGNGCNKTTTYTVRCYLLGNENLDPERSVNKEIGLSWAQDGWHAGLTYFRNDYQNKITGGSNLLAIVQVSGVDRYVYQWENATDAIVEGLEGNLSFPVSRTVNFSMNGTYMKRNDDKDGQPLSIVPRYTLNAFTDWQATEAMTVNFNVTFYGRQVPRTTSISTQLAATGEALSEVDPYHVLGVNAVYKIDPSLRLRLGISNLLDHRQYREGAGSTAGAATYNDPGRSFNVALTKSF